MPLDFPPSGFRPFASTCLAPRPFCDISPSLTVLRSYPQFPECPYALPQSTSSSWTTSGGRFRPRSSLPAPSKSSMRSGAIAGPSSLTISFVSFINRISLGDVHYVDRDYRDRFSASLSSLPLLLVARRNALHFLGTS